MTEPTPAEKVCVHAHVHFEVKNVWFKDTNAHFLEIFGLCSECRKPIQFRGAGRDVSFDAPSMTPDGGLMRLPFLCEGEKLKRKNKNG